VADIKQVIVGVVLIIALAILVPIITYSSPSTPVVVDEFTSCTGDTCRWDSSAPYFTKFANFTWSNGKINISYNNYYVILKPFVVYDNTVYSWEQTRTFMLNHNISLDVLHNDEGYRYKYGINLTNIPDTIKDKIDYIGLKLVGSQGLTWDDITLNKTGKYVLVKNRLKLSYSDLINSGYTVVLYNKSVVLIGNVSGKNELWLDPTIERNTGASANDAYEDDYSDAVDTTSASMYAGKWDSNEGPYRMGMRFTNILIPQGSTINSASIEIVPSSDFGPGNVYTKIQCQDIDDAPAFTTSSADISSRTLTTAGSDWDFTSLTAGTAVTTSDFTAAVQEVINRAGWSSGNALVVVIRDDGTDSYNRPLFASYDHTTYAEPKLTIDYTSSADSCSCPSPAADWYIDISDNCNITTDCNVDGYKVYFENGTSTDMVNISSTITADGFDFTNAGSGTTIFLTGTAYLKVT